MSAGGKGSSPRPFDVAFEQYAANFDLIFGKSKKNVLQQETENSNGQTQGTSATQAGGQVLRDSQSPSVSESAPKAE
jgi:hypothetical protein